MPSTIRLHRVLKAPPERVYNAFLNADAMAKWEGIPDVIPAEMCYLGWQESLVLLGKLVEAEIPDQG